MAKTDRPRVLLDTSAILAWVKGEPECDQIAGLLEFLDRGSGEMAESTLLLAEIFMRPGDDQSWGQRVENLLAKLRSRDVLIFDVTRPVAQRAAQYRLAFRMKTPDAIHLATAVLNQCSWLVTLDDGFPPEVEGVRVINPRRMGSDASLPWVVPTQDPLFNEGSNVVSLPGVFGGASPTPRVDVEDTRY